MNQTKLLLMSAREDCSRALNVLLMVSMDMLPAGIEEKMYAYMVALDWIEWIKNPKSSPENPLFEKSASYLPMLNLFKEYADTLSLELRLKEDEVEEIFKTLNPNLIHLWRSNDAVLKGEAKMFHRSLRVTAKLFKEKFGTTRFSEILDEKQVPPMS